MKEESKLNLNAGDYAISHCDSDKTYNGLEVHKMLCDAYIAGSNDTLEDDDERIKNSLINLIKMSSEFGGLALHKWEADEMLAWIEKQKDCIKLSDSAYTSNRDVIEFADKYSHTVWENLMDKFKKNENYSIGSNDVSDIVLNAIINTYNWLEKQDKQKPVISDDALREGIAHFGITQYQIDNWLKKYVDVEKQVSCTTIVETGNGGMSEENKGNIGGNSPNSAWSEDDETVLNNLIYELANDRIGNNRDEYVDWLKTIKGRVGCEANRTTTKEWSEEDKKKIDRIYLLIREAADEHAFGTTCRLIGDKECIELQDWLKSLKDRYTWKPSDEQMKALHNLNLTGNISYAGQGQVLIELYNDLKKLTE